MSLLYLARYTRPDILLVVSYLTTKSSKPNLQYYSKAKRILRYLIGTPNDGIFFSNNQNGNYLRGFVDASHGVHSDAKGQGGMIITLGTAPIFCRSFKLKQICISSTESEIVALSDTITYLIWLRQFLKEIRNDIYLEGPTVVYQDNTSAIMMQESAAGHFSRSKHFMFLRSAFVKEHIDNNEITLQYLPTEYMCADMLTKPVSKELLNRYKSLLCMNDGLLTHT
jgi:hypothetical protein